MNALSNSQPTLQHALRLTGRLFPVVGQRLAEFPFSAVRAVHLDDAVGLGMDLLNDWLLRLRQLNSLSLSLECSRGGAARLPWQLALQLLSAPCTVLQALRLVDAEHVTDVKALQQLLLRAPHLRLLELVGPRSRFDNWTELVDWEYQYTERGPTLPPLHVFRKDGGVCLNLGAQLRLVV